MLCAILYLNFVVCLSFYIPGDFFFPLKQRLDRSTGQFSIPQVQPWEACKWRYLTAIPICIAQPQAPTMAPIPFRNYPRHIRSVHSKPGFASKTHHSIQLLVNQNVTLDLKPSLSSVSQNIEVTAAPPALETTSATMGKVIQHDQIVDCH